MNQGNECGERKIKRVENAERERERESDLLSVLLFICSVSTQKKKTKKNKKFARLGIWAFGLCSVFTIILSVCFFKTFFFGKIFLLM